MPACIQVLSAIVLVVTALCCVKSVTGYDTNGSVRQAPPFVLLNPHDFDTWTAENAPLFQCSDFDLTAAYAFRWRVYRAHIRKVEGWGHVVTEFLPPVSWAGPFDTIVGSAGHHIYEGRWLRDGTIMDDYSRFWFGGAAQSRAYTAWLTNAIYNRALVSGDFQLPLELLGPMRENLAAWEASHWLGGSGCFWQSDTADGGEDSISGDGCRVSINSVMYGEWVALAALEQMASNHSGAAALAAKAEALRERVLDLLWEPRLQFLTGFMPPTRPSAARLAASGSPPNSRCPQAPKWPPGANVPVRELLALSTPHYFGMLPAPGDARQAAFGRMWDQLSDPAGFAAPWGPRTAERRHAAYNFTCDHPCTWNGPTWPFETARLLTGLASFLAATGPDEGAPDASLWMRLARQYARLHTRAAVPQPSDLAGRSVPEHPWIGESAHPDEGYWLSRAYMLRHGEPDWRRGFMYNHATFADLIITGLVGLRPRADSLVHLRPLGCQELSSFALDGVMYHGRLLSVAWDPSGERYGRGRGLHVWVDGQLAFSNPACGEARFELPGERTKPVLVA